MQKTSKRLFAQWCKDVDYQRQRGGCGCGVGKIGRRCARFLVEKGTRLHCTEMKGKHSLRASATGELVFQDCRNSRKPAAKCLRT